MQKSEQDKLEQARKSLTGAEVIAAAKIIYEAGRHRGWSGFKEKTFENLDPIGRDEFLGIIERALAAALVVRGRGSSRVE